MGCFDNGSNILSKCVDDVYKYIPCALWDSVSEQMRQKRGIGYWLYCLECIKQMADAWKTLHGDNIIWVPGHYETLDDQQDK